VRTGSPTAVVALTLAGSASMGDMATMNFIIRSDLRWLLFSVAALWAAASVVAAVEVAAR
jgi:hypothetical protein